MENFQQPLTFPAINGKVFTELTALTSQSANKIINVILLLKALSEPIAEKQIFVSGS